MKKIILIIAAVLIAGIFIFGYLQKDKLNRFISEKMQEQVSPELAISSEEFIDSNYNYSKNNKDYEFTFLEFSSTGCAICEQMKPVLEEIENSKKVKVNVVFLHILKSENQELMKYFGISAVPMQILLDKKGKQFYKHYGFISASELETLFIQQKS